MPYPFLSLKNLQPACLPSDMVVPGLPKAKRPKARLVPASKHDQT